ncbi:unnamed protein product [Caenorhabditis auriculariae]|uniref:Uncharacterized protein n=1 Tax=Caenorhabditis auriculariae TaxID=2777116 RepID=A0A8S1H6U5_9PELO|nr:unnamed protein product [Caenorhabditis auriculariae]
MATLVSKHNSGGRYKKGSTRAADKLATKEMRCALRRNEAERDLLRMALSLADDLAGSQESKEEGPVGTERPRKPRQRGHKSAEE